MANPYEIEHGIKEEPSTQNGRPDMSSFFSQLSQIETTTADSAQHTHNNTHAVPTPNEVSAADSLLRDQMLFHIRNASSEAHTSFLEGLVQFLQSAIDNPPKEVQGVPQSYLDALDRIPKKALKKSDACPICGVEFLDDEYPLVVELPCHKTHRFDLECIGPWLRMHSTCPLDRKDLLKKKEIPKQADDDEDGEYDDFFA